MPRQFHQNQATTFVSQPSLLCKSPWRPRGKGSHPCACDRSPPPPQVPLSSSPDPLPPTPITEIEFRGRRFFVKRDDTLSISGLTGSKARKFRSLTLPGALDGIDVIASFGGVQSNAMRSLALFANNRQIPFIYYIPRPVPARLRRQPSGNLHDALEAGMMLRPIPEDIYRHSFQNISPGPGLGDAAVNTGTVAADDARAWVCDDLHDEYSDSRRILFIPQGGAWPPAEEGVRQLAEELVVQLAEMRKSGGLSFPRKVPMLFCGAGTGATAFFLARHLEGKVRVLAVPVAGSAEYLIQQMRWLEEATLDPPKRLGDEAMSSLPPCTSRSAPTSDEQRSLQISESKHWPEVLRPRIRATFADIREGKLLIFRELERAAAAASEIASKGGAPRNLHFDLIYGPNAWEEVSLALDEGRLVHDRDYIFLHTGGVEANETMLDRFHFKKLISEEEASLLGSGLANSSDKGLAQP